MKMVAWGLSAATLANSNFCCYSIHISVSESLCVNFYLCLIFTAQGSFVWKIVLENKLCSLTVLCTVRSEFIVNLGSHRLIRCLWDAQ